jgi:hypothetical protein
MSPRIQLESFVDDGRKLTTKDEIRIWFSREGACIS